MIMKKLLLLLLLCAIPFGLRAQYKFVDVTNLAGIDAQSVGIGDIGGGVVIFDYDNDGWEDFYCAGGLFSDYLFRNNHDGTFSDVAPFQLATHSGFRTYSHGGTAFDYDNDGFNDLFICSEGRDLMWKGHGDTNWVDVSQKVGIHVENELNESNCASFGDYNGDGFNDLYVARWVREQEFTFDTLHNRAHYNHTGWPNYLYYNNGDGTFTERGQELGVDDQGTSNIALFCDYDRDGDLDVFSGNDFGFDIIPNQVYKNMLMETGKPTFENVTKATGLGEGLFCMGITPNDYDRDGNLDFYETSIGPMAMMHNDGTNHFTNVIKEVGLPDGFMRFNKAYMTVTWSTLHDDWDNDGWDDAFIVHGYLDAIPPFDTYEQDTSIFMRNVDAHFHDVTDSMDFYMDQSGRGAGNIDFDQDGRNDILFGSVAKAAGIKTQDFRLWHNETPRGASEGPGRKGWLEITCTARRTAKEAIGTTIDVWTAGIRHTRQVTTGGTFGSLSSLTQHFGCAAFDKADSIVIYWPADRLRHRQIDRYFNVPLNQRITYAEDSVGMWAERAFAGTPKALEARPLKIYPVPATTDLTIERSTDGKCRIELYDMLGIRLKDMETNNLITTIPVATLSPGAYTIRITSGRGIETRQFIKK